MHGSSSCDCAQICASRALTASPPPISIEFSQIPTLQEILTEEGPFPLASASTEDQVEIKDESKSMGVDAHTSDEAESKNNPSESKTTPSEAKNPDHNNGANATKSDVAAKSDDHSEADTMSGWSMKVSWEPKPEAVFYPETDQDRDKARREKNDQMRKEEDEQRKKQMKK